MIQFWDMTYWLKWSLSLKHTHKPVEWSRTGDLLQRSPSRLRVGVKVTEVLNHVVFVTEPKVLSEEAVSWWLKILCSWISSVVALLTAGSVDWCIFQSNASVQIRSWWWPRNLTQLHPKKCIYKRSIFKTNGWLFRQDRKRMDRLAWGDKGDLANPNGKVACTYTGTDEGMRCAGMNGVRWWAQVGTHWRCTLHTEAGRSVVVIHLISSWIIHSVCHWDEREDNRSLVSPQCKTRYTVATIQYK